VKIVGFLMAFALLPTRVAAQLTRDRIIAGVIGGAADLRSPNLSTASVVTGILRYQARVLSLEFSLPLHTYSSVIPDSPIREEVGAVALSPEMGLQLNHQFDPVEIYLDAGTGFAMALKDPAFSGPTLHGAAGIRLRLAKGVLGRIEVGSRRIHNAPSTLEIQFGLEGWPR